jgi:hypothetical protein
MTFMGRKVATKDIDIVFGSAADARDFAATIRYGSSGSSTSAGAADDTTRWGHPRSWKIAGE